MLDRIKAFAEASKNVIIYILTPIAFVLGALYYLLTKNKELTEQVKQEKFDVTHNNTIDEQKTADATASDALSEYEKLRSAYVSGNPGSLRQGSSGPDETGGDQGPPNKAG